MDLGGVSAADSSNSGHKDKAAEHLWRGNFKAHKLSKFQNLLFGLHSDKYTKLTSPFFLTLNIYCWQICLNLLENTSLICPPSTQLSLQDGPTWDWLVSCVCCVPPGRWTDSVSAPWTQIHTDLWIVERTPLSSGLWQVKAKKKKRVAFIFWFSV